MRWGILSLRHKQGNAGVRPDGCRSLYGEAAGEEFVVLRFTGKLEPEKLRGVGQRPTDFYAVSLSA